MTGRSSFVIVPVPLARGKNSQGKVFILHALDIVRRLSIRFLRFQHKRGRILSETTWRASSPFTHRFLLEKISIPLDEQMSSEYAFSSPYATIFQGIFLMEVT